MSEIKGIYAASLSVLDSNLALNNERTVQHIENLIDIVIFLLDHNMSY